MKARIIILLMSALVLGIYLIWFSNIDIVLFGLSLNKNLWIFAILLVVVAVLCLYLMSKVFNNLPTTDDFSELFLYVAPFAMCALALQAILMSATNLVRGGGWAISAFVSLYIVLFCFAFSHQAWKTQLKRHQQRTQLE